jgi:hypothetical protein
MVQRRRSNNFHTAEAKAMIHATKGWPWSSVAVGLLTAGSVGAGSALGQAGIVNQVDDNAPVARARFQSVAGPSGYYGNPYYPGYGYLYDPYGAALSGSADVINAQGQFIVSQQQGYLMREQYRQKKIETRRKNVDEYIYERAVLPTPEDDRERQRLENLRRARNDPPSTEIWSARSLNDLLVGIQQQIAKKIDAPDIALDEDVLKHINVSGGGTLASLGLFRDGGRLQWPLAFVGDEFREDRKAMDQLALEAMKQIDSGPADAGTVRAMGQAVDRMADTLKGDVDNISTNDYIKAKRFLSELRNSLNALQDPSVTNYAKGKWSAKGRNVAELVTEMSRQGLKFAPAVSGDEAAYTALQRALADYYVYPAMQANRWDPAAK